VQTVLFPDLAFFKSFLKLCGDSDNHSVELAKGTANESSTREYDLWQGTI